MLTPSVSPLTGSYFARAWLAEGWAYTSKSLGDAPLCCTGFIVYNMKSSEVAGCVGTFFGEVLWMVLWEVWAALAVEMNFFSEFTRAKKSLGIEAATATVCVIFFHYGKVVLWSWMYFIYCLELAGCGILLTLSISDVIPFRTFLSWQDTLAFIWM